MKPALIVLVFLQCHYISGWSLLNVKLAANLALSASIDEMNARSLTINLYRATNKAVRQIKLVDFNTYDLTVNFGIRATMCLKPLKVSLHRCQFKWGMSMPEYSCSTHVRVSGVFISLKGMSCSVHAISSSSEEISLWNQE